MYGSVRVHSECRVQTHDSWCPGTDTLCQRRDRTVALAPSAQTWLSARCSCRGGGRTGIFTNTWNLKLLETFLKKNESLDSAPLYQKKKSTVNGPQSFQISVISNFKTQKSLTYLLETWNSAIRLRYKVIPSKKITTFQFQSFQFQNFKISKFKKTLTHSLIHSHSHSLESWNLKVLIWLRYTRKKHNNNINIQIFSKKSKKNNIDIDIDININSLETWKSWIGSAIPEKKTQSQFQKSKH